LDKKYKLLFSGEQPLWKEMVEVEGIEPSSRNKKTRTSTHLACLFISPTFSPTGRIESRLAKVDFFTLPPFAKGKASPALLTP